MVSFIHIVLLAISSFVQKGGGICGQIFKSREAQCGYRGPLKEIYVPINGDFQEPLSMESHTCCLKKLYLPT